MTKVCNGAEREIYPANRYLRFANRVNKATGEFVDLISQESSNQESIPPFSIKFVKDHPDYFIPRPTDTLFEDLNRYNSTINGDNPDKKFISRFI